MSSGRPSAFRSLPLSVANVTSYVSSRVQILQRPPLRLYIPLFQT